MKGLPNEIMGYDRAITVFSPDGRLLQVEYARKTVSQGSTAIGLVCKDGIILAADKRILEKFVVADTIEKIHQIDKHIGATMSGLISDGRVLIDMARVKAQNHRVTYEEPTDVLSLVKEVANQQQAYTQYAGARPYGVALLIAGVDETGPRIFMTEPSGIYFEYKAVSVGDGAKEVNKTIEKKYKESMTTKQGLNLAIDALKEALGKKFNKDRLDVSIISTDGKKYKKLSKDDISKLLKK